VDFCGIGIALDYVQDADVTTLFAGGGTDHAILGLEKTTHDIQYRCLANCFRLLLELNE
jgi:hypothetical protein